jgi:CBS domain containing-hemolysin-like protein
MSDWLGIVALIALLAVNAFFVASEFAVISARRSQIEPLASRSARWSTRP